MSNLGMAFEMRRNVGRRIATARRFRWRCLLSCDDVQVRCAWCDVKALDLEPCGREDIFQTGVVESVQMCIMKAAARRVEPRHHIRHFNHHQPARLQPAGQSFQRGGWVGDVFQNVMHGDGVKSSCRKIDQLQGRRADIQAVGLTCEACVSRIGLNADNIVSGARQKVGKFTAARADI